MSADPEARIKHLESLVDVLCKNAGVTVVECTHPACQLGEGFWQDGETCGFCNGTRKIIQSPGTV